MGNFHSDETHTYSSNVAVISFQLYRDFHTTSGRGGTSKLLTNALVDCLGADASCRSMHQLGRLPESLNVTTIPPMSGYAIIYGKHFLSLFLTSILWICLGLERVG